MDEIWFQGLLKDPCYYSQINFPNFQKEGPHPTQNFEIFNTWPRDLKFYVNVPTI